ncbi:MAG: hypothetical protein WC989_02390 [Micavibrio sp.]
MGNTVQKLGRLWRAVNADMEDETMRRVLQHVAYTDTLHKSFTAIISGDMEADPQKLGWIFKPLRRYYNARIKKASADIESIGNDREELATKITPLFRHKVSPALAAAYRENRMNGKRLSMQMEQHRQFLADMDWAIADPRLTQNNLPLQQHYRHNY